jgi:hypothetical protein
MGGASAGPCCLEALERRFHLHGITIITHGWNSDSGSWVTEMANAISRSIVYPTGDASTVAQYTIRAVAGSPVAIQAPVRNAGAADWGTTGEAILKLDWGPLSGGLFSGTPTGVVADAFANFLLTQTVDGHSVFEGPVHLIGHSRGASLNTQLSRRLAERGVWIDQVTMLDPHPVDGANEDIPGTNFGDAPMNLWDNVRFADNYWRSDNDPFDFNGEPVSGAKSVQLSDSALSGGYSFAHQNVHLWYHGTIGPQVTPFAPYPNGDGSESVGSNWYASPHPARETSGFFYSRLAGGVRANGDVGTPFGGSASRSPAPRIGSQWPNIDGLSLRHHPSRTISQAERIFLSYQYQDLDSGGTVTFYADPDTNPYNGNSQALPGQQSVGSNGITIEGGLFHASAAGLSTGSWHVYGRIGDPSGNVRYSFLPEPITVTSAAPVPTITSNETKFGAIEQDSADVYSFAANLGDVFTLSMGDAGSSVDPQLDLYGPDGALLASEWGAFTTAIDAHQADVAGTYYVVARDHGGDHTGAYTLTLTVPNTPPAVTDVFVSGSAWTQGYRDFIQSTGEGDATYGYRLTDLLHADELPWINLNRISLRFGEDVDLAAGAVKVYGVNVAQYAGGFTYDAATFTATWTLTTGVFGTDKLMLAVDGSLITDDLAQPLDGEWTNLAETTPVTSGGADTFPSGDGMAGGDFLFRMNVLPGDVNRDGEIVGNDVTSVRSNQGFVPGGAGYTIFRDLNGDTQIVGNDVTAVRSRQGIQLPPGDPSMPAPISTFTLVTPRPFAMSMSMSMRNGMSQLARPLDVLAEEIEEALLRRTPS